MKNKANIVFILFFIPFIVVSQTYPVVKEIEPKDSTTLDSKVTEVAPPIVSSQVQGNITAPLPGNSFIDRFIVTGWVKHIPKGKYLWLLNCPQESVECWPQFKNITINPSSGKFEAKAQIGGKPNVSHDIKLVIVGYETHILFSNYIRNGSFDNGIFLPEDVETLGIVTVIKKDNSIPTLYGVTTKGTFFLHKSLVEEVEGSIPYLRTSLDNWSTDYEMNLNEEYYYVSLPINKDLNRKILYAINVGQNKFLPHALLNVFSDLINEDDCVDNGNNGYNFQTMPLNQAPF